jgi:predicted DCC family thiol-disulfide oxidoreductase YuxK
LNGTELSYTAKVNATFTLEQAKKAQMGSRSIALLFLNLGARWRWVVNVTLLPLYLRE